MLLEQKNPAMSCKNSPKSHKMDHEEFMDSPIEKPQNNKQGLSLFARLQNQQYNKLKRKGTKGSDPGQKQNDEDNLIRSPFNENAKEMSEINTHKVSEVNIDDIELPSPDIDRKLNSPV